MKKALLGAVFCASLVEAVQAAPTPAVLDFGIVPGGQVSWAGGSNPFIGSAISIANVEGVNTPLNNLVVTLLSGGMMNFVTGNYMSGGPSNWVFGGGGNFIIDGGVPSVSISNGTTLITGTFSSVQVINVGGGDFNVVVGSLIDTINSDLLAFYGVGPLPQFEGALAFQFLTDGNPMGGPFTSTTILSGNDTNDPPPTGTPPTDTPEPISMAMLSTGFVGLAFIRRRKART